MQIRATKPKMMPIKNLAKNDPLWAFPNLVVQRHAHSPVIKQGRADIARCRKRGTHRPSSDPRWTASSKWADAVIGPSRRCRPIPFVYDCKACATPLKSLTGDRCVFCPMARSRARRCHQADGDHFRLSSHSEWIGAKTIITDMFTVFSIISSTTRI
jgi:hypothetical protein